MTGPQNLEDTIGLYTYIYQQFELRKKKKQRPSYISLTDGAKRVADLTKKDLGEVLLKAFPITLFWYFEVAVVCQIWWFTVIGVGFTQEIQTKTIKLWLAAYLNSLFPNLIWVERLRKKIACQ